MQRKSGKKEAKGCRHIGLHDATVREYRRLKREQRNCKQRSPWSEQVSSEDEYKQAEGKREHNHWHSRPKGNRVSAREVVLPKLHFVFPVEVDPADVRIRLRGREFIRLNEKKGQARK